MIAIYEPRPRKRAARVAGRYLAAALPTKLPRRSLANPAVSPWAAWFYVAILFLAVLSYVFWHARWQIPSY